MSRKSPRLPVEGEVFFLTSPFIDQGVILKIRSDELLGQFPSHLILQIAETVGTDPAIVVLGDISLRELQDIEEPYDRCRR